MYDSVLVGTDGSEDAAVAIEYAVELANRLDVPLHGLAVVEERIAYDNAIVDPESVERQLRDSAQDALDELERTAAEQGVSVLTSVRSGVPHEEILAYADEYDVSTIVVGSQGRSAFKRALLGSTTDALVRLSPVPVLVVGGGDGTSDK